jgi:hypothetical protein
MSEPASTNDPVADLRNAADLIREQHPPGDPLWAFWRSVASGYGVDAARAASGAIRNITEWNETVRGARAYLDAGGIRG